MKLKHWIKNSNPKVLHTHIPETYNEIKDELSIINKLLKDQSISNHKYERKHGVILRKRRRHVRERERERDKIREPKK